MTTRWKADELVLNHSSNVGKYKHNFLQQAVCEFRFPTLMELGEARPPTSLVKALRKNYPILELGNELTVGMGGASTGTSHVHTFRSVKMNWSISLKHSAISIETSSYAGYANMRERILSLIQAASEIIDSDFFTRVGLRYINVVPCEQVQLNEWINPSLVQPVADDTFRGISEYGGRMSLLAEDGGCIIQHGIRLKNTSHESEPVLDYVLDIDTFRSEISLADAPDALDIMHQQAFNIFDWSLSDKARIFLAEHSKP